MTTACAISLGISLLCYFVATLLFQGHLLWRKNDWDNWGRKALWAGMGVNAVALILHSLFTGQSPFSNQLSIASLLIISFLLTGLLIEHYGHTRHLGLFLSPLAFIGLLYPVLMPIRLDQAESMLLHYPWLGTHVFITLLGHIGFALAFCTAILYRIQSRALKQGRLNRFLPALETASAATYYTAGAGFVFFTLGLGLGVIWLFGAPGEYLGTRDAKIWLALPAWILYATYIYLRGFKGRYGSRLKWLVIVGFLLVLANLVGVRHHFEDTPVGSTLEQLFSEPKS
jgi:ABC-type transport system involved in cytochrome c biogenesis permease subunit